MNSNSIIFSPYLLAFDKIDLNNSEECLLTFKGFVDILTVNYFVLINAVFNKKTNQLIHIEVDCEPKLNNLLLSIKDALNKRLHNCQTIEDFISELKNLIESQLKKNSNEGEQNVISNNDLFTSIEYYKHIVSELDKIGWRSLKRVNESFTELVLVYEENERVHELQINLTEQFPKKEPVFIAELPNKFSFNWNQNSSLVEVYVQFINDVNSYALFWDEMNLLDNNCWVLEPLKPTRTDFHRRISITNNVSMQIKIDPRNPREIPQILFLGSETSIESFKTKYEDNFNDWNPNISVYYNLEELLGIKLPSKCDEYKKEDLDVECGICYSYLCNNEGPDLYCETESCNKAFHQNCLYEWLKNSPKCKTLFGLIYGECPYCSESIKCKIFND